MKEFLKILIGPYDFLYEEHDMEFMSITRRDKSDTWYVRLKIDNKLIFVVSAINTDSINTYFLPCDKSGNPTGSNVTPSFMRQYLLNEEVYEQMKVGEKEALFLRKNMKNVFAAFTKNKITRTYKYIDALKSKNDLERGWTAFSEEAMTVRFKQIKVLDRLPVFREKSAKQSVLDLVDSPEYAQKNAKHHIGRAIHDMKYEPTQEEIDRVVALPLMERFNGESVKACLRVTT